MKTLVIHPDDPSTENLKAVYQNIQNCTVITGGVSVAFVHQQIIKHDRVIMLGHGTSLGLLAMGNFTDETVEVYEDGYSYVPLYVVDESSVAALSKKQNNIYIWCYASDYVKAFGLKGFCSGMYISELMEAYLMGIDDQTHESIEAQFKHFCELVGTVAEKPAREMYNYVRTEYGKGIDRCPITKYNHERLWVAE
jgi:hypothetical protein